MTPDATLMGMLGSAFQIFTFSALALFVFVLIAIVWLCCNEHKSPDK